jgi:hypothetical protein
MVRFQPRGVDVRIVPGCKLITTAAGPGAGVSGSWVNIMTDVVEVPESPKIYLFGDTGHDQVTAPNGSSFRIKSGALFMHALMTRLLDSSPPIELLVAAATKLDRDDVTAPCFSALPESRVVLQNYDKCTRIKSYDLTKAQAAGTAEEKSDRSFKVVPLGGQISKGSLLVAHHVGPAWRDTAASQFATVLETFFKATEEAETGDGGCELPDVIVNVSAGFPELASPVLRNSRAKPLFDSDLWNTLHRNRHRVAVVVSASTCRREGAALTRRLSWEQSVEDLAAEIHLFPKLAALSSFRHLFVRFGMVGLVHIERNERTPRATQLGGTVYFSPYAKNAIHRDHEREGGTVGRNSIFIAELVRHLLLGREGAESADFPLHDVVSRSFNRMRAMDDGGYRLELEGSKTPSEAFIESGAEKARSWTQAESEVAGAATTLSWRPIPAYLLGPPVPNQLRPPAKWHMLDDVLLEGPVHRVNVAMAIAKAGYDQVLNCTWSEPSPGTARRAIWDLLTRVEYFNPKDDAPDFVTLRDGHRPATPDWPGGEPTTDAIIGKVDRPFRIDVPVMELRTDDDIKERKNRLTLIERDDVESIRSIANLIASYRDKVLSSAKPEEAQPLSIAVFGTPGSGKSFAVRSIAEVLGMGTMPALEFNVAQFRDVEDLTNCFVDVAAAKERKKAAVAEAFKMNGKDARTAPVIIPLVFFDEFDCTLGSTELGWLKYFLAPMQDGMYRKDNKAQTIGGAVFVFAGGLHPTFERFDPRTDSAYDNLRSSAEYLERVRKFVDRKGPDFISRLRGHINVLEINEMPGRRKHFIRRAVQLRSILEKNGRARSGELAGISDAILYALLTVDRYRHGVRSMQAIVEMCTPIYGRVEIASLPSRAQLNMHVDADEFLVRVHRGRARDQPDWDRRQKSERAAT